MTISSGRPNHLISSLSKDEVFHRSRRGLVLRQAQDEADLDVQGYRLATFIVSPAK